MIGAEKQAARTEAKSPRYLIDVFVKANISELFTFQVLDQQAVIALQGNNPLAVSAEYRRIDHFSGPQVFCLLRFKIPKGQLVTVPAGIQGEQVLPVR